MKNNVLVRDIKELKFNTSCLITNIPFTEQEINNNNVIKLKCGHGFKYEILLKAFRIMNKTRYGQGKCPYCFSRIGYIPIILNREQLAKVLRKIKKKDTKKELYKAMKNKIDNKIISKEDICINNSNKLIISKISNNITNNKKSISSIKFLKNVEL